MSEGRKTYYKGRVLNNIATEQINYKAYYHDIMLFGKDLGSKEPLFKNNCEYVYKINSATTQQLEFNTVMDVDTVVQIKIRYIKGGGGYILSSTNHSDSNYSFRLFVYSNQWYFDAYGKRNKYGTATANTDYILELGYDSTNKIKYVRRLDEEVDEVVGFNSNPVSTYDLNYSLTSPTMLTNSKLQVKENATDYCYYYFIKVYKNGVLVNNYRPNKFDDGKYGFIDVVNGDEYKDTENKLIGVLKT